MFFETKFCSTFGPPPPNLHDDQVYILINMFLPHFFCRRDSLNPLHKKFHKLCPVMTSSLFRWDRMIETCSLISGTEVYSSHQHSSSQCHTAAAPCSNTSAQSPKRTLQRQDAAVPAPKPPSTNSSGTCSGTSTQLLTASACVQAKPRAIHAAKVLLNKGALDTLTLLKTLGYLRQPMKTLAIHPWRWRSNKPTNCNAKSILPRWPHEGRSKKPMLIRASREILTAGRFLRINIWKWIQVMEQQPQQTTNKRQVCPHNITMSQNMSLEINGSSRKLHLQKIELHFRTWTDIYSEQKRLKEALRNALADLF